MPRYAHLYLPLVLALSSVVGCGSCGDDEDPKGRSQTAPPPTSATLVDQRGELQTNTASNFDVPVMAQQHLVVDLTSEAFDPVVEIALPGGQTLVNDDHEGNRQRSHLGVVAPQAGIMKITVRANGSGAGAFHLVVSKEDNTTGSTLLTAGAQREATLNGNALPDGRFQERLLVAGADAGPMELRIEASGETVPLAIVLDPQGRALTASASGVYPIVHPGTHRVQLISPEPGKEAGYRISIRSAAATAAPRLARDHHQFPTTTASTAIELGANLRGEISDSDPALPSGEHADVYSLNGAANQRIHVELRSTSDLDPYLMLLGPTGQYWENDDAGGGTDSVLDVTLPTAGTYKIVATAYRATMTGSYELKVDHGATSPMPNTATANTTAVVNATTRSGELGAGDATLPSGEFFDRYNFAWPAGARIQLRATSSAFDTYLIVRSPSGQDQQNDDENSSQGTNAGLVYTASEAGAYTVLVTSYESGETGAYELNVTPAGQAAAGQGAAGQAGSGATPTPNTGAAEEGTTAGTLAAGDSTRGTGQFVDTHTMQFTAGQSVNLELHASFDTVLTVRSPSGRTYENDDAPGMGTDSAVSFVAEAGDHQVTVSSYSAGETGAYRLVQRSAQPTPHQDAAPAAGPSVRGTLAQGDRRLESGEFTDTYQRTFQPGEAVQVRLESSAFDPYLIVRSPGGHQSDNDDFNSSTRNAGIDIPSAEAGSYSIQVTSYQPGETGPYELRFGAGQAAPGINPSGDGPQVYGLFAGITDYPGSHQDLPECANDAIKLAETLREHNLMTEANQVVLTDAQATTGNLRSAMQRLSSQIGPEDIFVFFYSGHGGQTERSTDSREIDGKDEYLVMHDDPILDNDMGELFNGIQARVAVLTLDACFSGGFAKDVITRPGRVGLFSSEEDVLSAVASQFQAGGYLSHFMRTAVGGAADRAPQDQVLTVGELTHYLYTQFGQHATDVELQGAYQHLVVDRGAVGVDQVLWAYR